MMIALLAAAALEPSRLQPGTTWAGTEELHFVSKEAEINESHRFKVVFRVTRSVDGLWEAEKRSSLLGSHIDDVDLPPPSDSTPVVSKSYFSPAGFLMDEEPFELPAFNLDRLISFWLPRNEPDTWSADLTTSGSHYAAKSHAEFKLLGKPTGPTRRYSFSAISPPAQNDLSASGAMRFDVASGRLIEAKLKVKHAVVPGGSDRVDVDLTYTDAPLPKP
ncbi:MAG TPA: hypothetical protein VG820_00100 [Fimbriimonadaceae bacterium]|nr:hypothetical protein [Fimbriimonadaceae bacterium]